MSKLRFNHIFILLLVLSALSAFVMPDLSAGVRGHAQGIFTPIARPVRLAAGAVHGRVAREAQPDPASVQGQPRPAERLLAENEQLRLEVANLTQQLNTLQEIHAERNKLGPVLQFCTPVAVIGADSGQRESLSLAASAADGVRSGMPVLYSGGIAGRVDRVGVGGVQARLITDAGFRIPGSFARFRQSDDGHVEYVRIATPPPLVEGMGNGTLSVRNLTLRDVEAADLAAGDWVVLSDPDWPLPLQGYKLGRIASIAPRPRAPLFAEIRLQPAGNLMQLREVMVMNR